MNVFFKKYIRFCMFIHICTKCFYLQLVFVSGWLQMKHAGESETTLSRIIGQGSCIWNWSSMKLDIGLSTVLMSQQKKTKPNLFKTYLAWRIQRHRVISSIDLTNTMKWRWVCTIGITWDKLFTRLLLVIVTLAKKQCTSKFRRIKQI